MFLVILVVHNALRQTSVNNVYQICIDIHMIKLVFNHAQQAISKTQPILHVIDVVIFQLAAKIVRILQQMGNFYFINQSTILLYNLRKYEEYFNYY